MYETRLTLAGKGIPTSGTIGYELFDKSTMAVSYTHLRAHETVLDLVCRLLLEKKKTQRHTKLYVNKQVKIGQ